MLQRELVTLGATVPQFLHGRPRLAQDLRAGGAEPVAALTRHRDRRRPSRHLRPGTVAACRAILARCALAFRPGRPDAIRRTQPAVATRAPRWHEALGTEHPVAAHPGIAPACTAGHDLHCKGPVGRAPVDRALDRTGDCWQTTTCANSPDAGIVRSDPAIVQMPPCCREWYGSMSRDAACVAGAPALQRRGPPQSDRRSRTAAVGPPQSAREARPRRPEPETRPEPRLRPHRGHRWVAIDGRPRWNASAPGAGEVSSPQGCRFSLTGR
jgi:hypothetical protein